MDVNQKCDVKFYCATPLLNNVSNALNWSYNIFSGCEENCSCVKPYFLKEETFWKALSLKNCNVC